MPLVNIDIVKGSRSPQQIRKLADTIHHVLIEHFNAPKKDRYVGHVYYEHARPLLN